MAQQAERKRQSGAKPHGRALPASVFALPVLEAAPRLLGVTLLVDGVGGPIVEVEAYHQSEPAAHSHRGPTPRAKIMFGAPGHAYVYRSYGLHWCLNFVCEGEGTGAAVLIRALAPTHSVATMEQRRGRPLRELCSGPGRVCAALGITVALNGARLDRPPFQLIDRSAVPEIVAGPRIGITKAVDLPWRFAVAGSPFLSRRAG